MKLINLLHMKKIILAFLIIIPFSLFSQSKLVPGFIIKPGGDTVRGYLKELSEKKVQDKIYFASSPGSVPSVTTTHDITGFGYEGGNTYNKVKYTHPVDLTTDERFAKKLVEGYNRLYMFWQKEKRYFIINTYDDSTYLLFDDNFSSSGIMSEYGNYKNRLLYLSVACDSLKGLLDYLDYRQNDIAKYVDRLNKCILPSEQNAIVYTKDKSYLNIYAYAGAIPLGKMYEYTGRIIGRFTIPSIDKNMSINVGVNFMAHKKTTSLPRTYYNSPEREQVDYKNIYTMPFTIQYNLIQGRVSPYVDAGLSFAYIDDATQITNLSKAHDRKFGIGVVVAAGVEGRITSRLMAKAEWRHELFLHYPTVGIGYFFK
jgi:hypothetical protein